RTVPSSEPETISLPPARDATPVTGPRCPWKSEPREVPSASPGGLRERAQKWPADPTSFARRHPSRNSESPGPGRRARGISPEVPGGKEMGQVMPQRVSAPPRGRGPGPRREARLELEPSGLVQGLREHVTRQPLVPRLEAPPARVQQVLADGQDAVAAVLDRE